jgi:L-amino acid N-acyltransferase YncA
MAEVRAAVKNAADPKQVARADRKTRDARLEHLANIKAVMSTVYGRAVMWQCLTDAGVYRSVWVPSAEIHYRAGRQDFGHELMATLLEADEVSYEQMEREARARAKRENDATDATHIKSAADTVEEQTQS